MSGDASEDAVQGPPSKWAIFRAICSLLCCPPLPSRIVAKVAFMPPPVSYRFLGEGDSRRLEVQAEFLSPGVSQQGFRPFTPPTLASVSVSTFRSRRGNQIAGCLLRVASANFTILYSHGNAVDIGQAVQHLSVLACELNCNIFVYDYSGYGLSTGRVCEDNIYADIHAAWTFLTTQLGIPSNRIVLYGQSIGTVATVDLATHVTAAGVILHAPLASGIRVLRPKTSITWCCDPFPSIKKIQRVTVPVFFMHGDQDEVVPVSHSHMLLEHTQRAVEPLFIPNGSHNDLETFDEYITRLVEFLFLLSE
eukprot:m.208340 g.208340  ORF g.208340 m.208340 type:complete len:307 (-) comp53929_c0_seq3:257-1177(-)